MWVRWKVVSQQQGDFAVICFSFKVEYLFIILKADKTEEVLYKERRQAIFVPSPGPLLPWPAFILMMLFFKYQASNWVTSPALNEQIWLGSEWLLFVVQVTNVPLLGTQLPIKTNPQYLYLLLSTLLYIYNAAQSALQQDEKREQQTLVNFHRTACC